MEQTQDMQDGAGATAPTGRYIHIAPKTHPLRGKLIERVPEGTKGAVQRTYENKKGESVTVHEMAYSYIVGSIIDLRLRERDVDWGRGPEKAYSAILVLDMVGERVSLEVPQTTRHWTPFFMALPNVDIAKKVRIETYDYDQKGTGVRKAGLSFRQMNIGTVPKGAEVNPKTNMYQVPWYWTKENPGKLPPAVKETNRRGETTWYFDDRDLYLRETVLPAIAERIGKYRGESPVTQEVQQEQAVPPPVAAVAQGNAAPVASMDMDDDMDDDMPPPPFDGNDIGDEDDQNLPF